jgi:hypothetical protein
VESRRSRVGQPRGRNVCVAVLIAAMAAMLLTPAGASAASPVLEFVVPGHSFPVSFTTESGSLTADMENFGPLVNCASSTGNGEITGLRTAVAQYELTGCTANGGNQTCNTEGPGEKEEEITTGPIDAELVWIDQARHEVGMLLNPGGGTYIQFECGGVPVVGVGRFLAPVGPLDQEAMSFTATLSRAGSMQTPDEYETANGEKAQAIPLGERNKKKELVPTGVEAAFMVHPSFSGEVRAITAAEVEAKQREEEAVTKKRQGEAAQKQQEEEAAVTAAAKKKQEEVAAATAAAKKQQEEEAAARKKADEEAAKMYEEKEKANKAKPLTRGQLLTRALGRCKKDRSKHKRMQCEKLVKKKYGAPGKTKKHKK